MASFLIPLVSNYLSLPESTVKEIAAAAPKTYRKYNIKKKNGGLRPIHHPAKQTKALQYALPEFHLNFGTYKQPSNLKCQFWGFPSVKA
jgi:hypothetical protein